MHHPVFAWLSSFLEQGGAGDAERVLLVETHRPGRLLADAQPDAGCLARTRNADRTIQQARGDASAAMAGTHVVPAQFDRTAHPADGRRAPSPAQLQEALQAFP